MARLRANGPDQPSPPIWPCSARGLPCPRRHRRGGGLLPHRFTLTGRFPRMGSGPRFGLSPLTGWEAPAVCSLLHFPWSRMLGTPWCYQARCPAESGLSSIPMSRVCGINRDSGRPAHPPKLSIRRDVEDGRKRQVICDWGVVSCRPRLETDGLRQGLQSASSASHQSRVTAALHCCSMPGDEQERSVAFEGQPLTQFPAPR